MDARRGSPTPGKGIGRIGRIGRIGDMADGEMRICGHLRTSADICPQNAAEWSKHGYLLTMRYGRVLTLRLGVLEMDTTKSRIGYVLQVCGNLRTSADICGHLRLARARVSGYPVIRLSVNPLPPFGKTRSSKLE